MFQSSQNKTQKMAEETKSIPISLRSKRSASLNNKSWQELIPKTRQSVEKSGGFNIPCNIVEIIPIQTRVIISKNVKSEEKCVSVMENKDDENEDENLADRIKKSSRGARAKRSASLNNNSWQQLIPKTRKSMKKFSDKVLKSGEKDRSLVEKKEGNMNEELKECAVIISKINWTDYCKRKRMEVRIKNIKIPQDAIGSDILERKVAQKHPFKIASVLKKADKVHFKSGEESQTHNQNKKKSFDIKPFKQLKLNPKTIKDRQNNDDILSLFNEGHSDDLFDSEKIPRYVSQLNLLDSSFSSDQESVSEHDANTPITKHLPQFKGWSAETPENLRVDQDEKENTYSNTPAKFSHLAFLHKTAIRRNREKNILRKNNGQNSLKQSANVSSSAGSSMQKKRLFSDLVSELEPAVENVNTNLHDASIDDQTEPWFDQDV